jgi:2-polyprenyl-3-methyl-5-hydroxy-6-metoxy-1,4-benzoquinol methylase
MRALPCPTCFSCGTVGVPLYQDLRDDLFSAPGTWALKQCSASTCGLLWLDPMPVPEDLHLAYQDYYTHGDPDKSLAHQLGKRAYALLLDAVLSIAGIPAERKRAALMFVGDRAPGTLLDVGCGHGVFLSVMAKRGWTVTGVDFDPAAVEAARTEHGLDVHVGTVDTMVDRGMSFDVVTASHVVEHVPDPVSFLAQCRRLLRPGGRVVLKTPNAASLGARQYGRAWRGLEPPRHLHIFTAAALEACARRAGFTGGDYFTSSVGADGILGASRILARKHSYRPHELSRMEAAEFRLMRPLLALHAKRAWWRDKTSGEELCAVLTNDIAASAE